MKYKGQEFDSYTAIIDHALKLKGKARELFVKAYAKSGPYALQNVGYFSGYYGPSKMAEIQEVFKTAHPIFGRTQPTAKQALEMGKRLAKR